MDTNSHGAHGSHGMHARGGVQGTPPLPVEGDGISYSGIVWFVVILTAVTVVCQILMWVLLRAMQHQAPDAATARAVMAPPVAAERQAVDGRVYPNMVAVGEAGGTAPQLLVQEPVNLERLRAQEHEVLTTYGITDKNAGMYRIPIDKAKDLLLTQGLPVRSQTASKDVKDAKEVKK
jgi:hypothetical protein